MLYILKCVQITWSGKKKKKKLFLLCTFVFNSGDPESVAMKIIMQIEPKFKLCKKMSSF